MIPAICLLIGLAVGGAVAWFVARKFFAARSTGIETELRAQLRQRDNDLATARAQLSESEQGRAKAETQAQAEKQRLSDLETQHERAMADLAARFKALSADALDKNSTTLARD